MRTRNYFKGLLMAAALTFGLASCESDELEGASVASATSSGEGLTITASVKSGPLTRAMIDLDNQDEEAEYFLWNEGDYFTLWYWYVYSETFSLYMPTTFYITDYSDKNPTNTATFTYPYYETGMIEEGTEVHGVYKNVGASMTATSIQIHYDVEFDMGANSEDEIKAYMTKYQFMHAKANFSESGMNLEFSQITSLARITYTNESSEEQSITSLSLSGNDYYFKSSEKYLLDEDTFGEDYSYCLQVSQSFSGLTVAPNETEEFYVLFLPSRQEFKSDGTLTITINDEPVTMPTADLNTSAFQNGYRYWFDVSKTDEGLEWTNYRGIDPSEELDGYTRFYRETNEELCDWIISSFSGIRQDTDGNVLIPESVIESTKELYFWTEDISLESLDGIGIFENLEVLYCNDFGLTSLDVSGLTKLRTLYCAGNDFTKLELKNLSLESLFMSGNENLEYLDCSGNQLTYLDGLDVCTKLNYLDCSNNCFTDFYLNNNKPDLSYVDISGNAIGSYDIREFDYLPELYCGNQTNKTMVLYLSDDQITTWEANTWKDDERNTDVSIHGYSGIYAGDESGTEGSGGLTNFENGGKIGEY